MPRSGWLLSALVFLTIALLFVAPSLSDPPTEKRTTHQMMRGKLSLSQQLLHSVVIEDYATAERQSNELAELTREAAWMAHRTDQYRLESVEFERSAYQLAAAAREKRLSETTLGFLGVTLSCVRCHRYLREADEIQSNEITIPPVAELSDDKEAKSVWMKKKLELSEAVLAGLAVGDAESIERNAQLMLTLSSVEGWARRKDAREYRALLESFRTANQELITSAAKKNLDGSALAFTQVVLNCVKCHHQLRDEEKIPERAEP